MKKVFADTAYFLALLNRDDALHGEALRVTDQGGFTMVTTAWVMTELADAYSSACHREGFLRFYRFLKGDPRTELIEASAEQFDKGIELYSRRLDKDWSLTDCISFVVMKDRGIQDALTGDHHFEQAGFVALLRTED